ncbi:hypothetical protein [Parasitella parasitica]|uniref:Uncharacterized protein n=1 Tax=Parasitella parasitica TaxID=35722 RepID=A0A0B7NKS7_9FUNG|nr:hypothetical protein [Parasitella parasitica]
MDDPNLQIRYQLEPAFVADLTNVINNTRYRLESLQRKCVTFNAEQWRHFLRVCGVRVDHENRAEIGIQKMQEDLTVPENVPLIFRNTIHTDDHTIEFIFGKRESEFESLPELTMQDLSHEDLARFHVHGIDPGHRHLVSAVDIERGRVRFSNNEWYQKAGVLKRRWAQQEKKKEKRITDIEASLLSRKTPDHESFVLCTQPLFDNLPEPT